MWQLEASGQGVDTGEHSPHPNYFHGAMWRHTSEFFLRYAYFYAYLLSYIQEWHEKMEIHKMKENIKSIKKKKKKEIP